MFPDTLLRRLAAVSSCLALSAPAAHAWVYPEHRDIAVLAVQTLDPQRRGVFDALWAEARAGADQRLCASGADAEQGVAPECIDWAAFTAIAGDHSCSAANMLDNVLNTERILTVADVSAQLKVDLSRLEVLPPPDQTEGGRGAFSDMQMRMQAGAMRAQRLRAVRVSDTRLQRADPLYATRAGANNAHFLLARPSPDISPQDYSALTLRLGSEISAIGVYGWYHLSAMQKATRLANEQFQPAERRKLLLAMLADEAFALHFLQDVFAAGYVAGTWGDASQRKGTHDIYNETGLEAFRWRGGSQTMVLMGDAHMRKEDAERAAATVRAGLEQVLDHAMGRKRASNIAHTPGAPLAPDGFDVCRNNTLPRRDNAMRVTRQAYELAHEVIGETPVPGLGPGLGAMPRFRAEVGPFVGIASSVDMRNAGSGFVEGETQNGWVAGAEVALRAGFGMEGVLGDSGDGLVFASVGLRGDTASSSSFSGASPAQEVGSSTALIPSRMALTARLRMPFYLIPGDLLLAAPLWLVSPEKYTQMAVTAANGGLLGLESGWATGIGRFQFILGRELGVSFYGVGSNDALLAPPVLPGGDARVVDFRSTMFDIPILEFRPYRAFDTKQSSALMLRLFAGIDVPNSGSVVYPAGAPGVNLKPVYSLGVRMVFDWRRYF